MAINYLGGYDPLTFQMKHTVGKRLDFREQNQQANPNSYENYKFRDLTNQTQPTTIGQQSQSQLTPSATNPSGGMMEGAGKMGSFAAGLGAVAGLVGGLMDNSNIRSQNEAIGGSIKTMENTLRELRAERQKATDSRRSDATNFLTQYVAVRDPNRSQGIAQMYQQGQNEYRNELANNTQLQAQTNANMANMQAQKQKEKEWWELGLGSAGSAGNAAMSVLPMVLMG